MFQRWRLKLREAEEAFARGRLEEARALLSQDDLQSYLPAKRLSNLVARGIADRGRRQVIAGDTSAGWRDIEIAREMAGETEEFLATRQELIDFFLQQAERHIRHREPSAAVSCIERLERRQVRNQKAARLKDVARRLESARKLCRRGRYAEAADQIRSARELRPDGAQNGDDSGLYTQWEEECRHQGTLLAVWMEELHRNLSAEKWSEALGVADRILELAPEHRLAREARKKVWTKVGARVADSRHVETLYWPRGDGTSVPAGDESESKGRRFQLWVDAVGGFLFCLDDDVTIGQSTPGSRVDIPILADVSTLHATIRRRGEGYLVDPHHPVSINGGPVRETAMLNDGDEIGLGSGVRLRFRQPHALSATARLDFVSRHRTRPSCDAVLLMAESCVLGPQWHNHVVCRDWTRDVVLFRHEGQLNCRAMDAFEIDGCLCDGRGPVGFDSHISGDDFSMSLERIT